MFPVWFSRLMILLLVVAWLALVLAFCVYAADRAFRFLVRYVKEVWREEE